MSKFANSATVLKSVRKGQTLTQKQYADSLKVHVQFVSNWERGLCLPPTPVMKKVFKNMSAGNKSKFESAITEDMRVSFMARIKG